MTPKERMLAAYRGEVPDSVPVSPELWDATAIAVAARPFHELMGPSAEVPWWRTHLAAFEYFGADAWIVPGAGPSAAQLAMTEEHSRFLDADTIETRTTYHTPAGALQAVGRTTAAYSGWLIEHPVRDFRRDMPRYEAYYFQDPRQSDLNGIAAALDGVGEKGLVTPMVGELFTSFLGSVREGGMVQTIYDLHDERGYCLDLRERYVAHVTALTRHVLEGTRAEAIFVNSGYSGPPTVSPRLYREWDVPVLAAVSAVCREHNVPLHLHQHGHVRVLLDDLIAAGVSIVCPLLPPPQGDVDDLAALKRQAAGRIALKGNVDPVETILRGTPDDVRQAVRRCIDAAAAGGGFVLGTADSTVLGTPLENIQAFVDAGRQYGRDFTAESAENAEAGR
ncbi:MAG: uroporphyrinogen decarboxylase family protein [Anaerolineae bacterium]